MILAYRAAKRDLFHIRNTLGEYPGARRCAKGTATVPSTDPQDNLARLSYTGKKPAVSIVLLIGQPLGATTHTVRCVYFYYLLLMVEPNFR